jgi:hypothetical protein
MNLAWTFGDFVSPKLRRPELGEVSYHWARWVSSGAAIAIDSAKFSAVHSCCLLQKDRLDPWVLQKQLAISPIPCRPLRLPKRIGLKSYFAAVGIGSKIILDYVIRRLDALSAGLKPVERLNLR